MKALSLFLAAFALAAALHAQQFDNPVSIPVSYYGEGAAIGAPASFSFGAELGAVNSASGSGYGYFYSSPTIGTMVPGQTYTVQLTSSGTPFVQVWFLPIDGCDFFIDGNKTSTMGFSSGVASFTVRVESVHDLAQSLAGSRGGQCSSLVADKPFWVIGLGSLRNGNFAGAVGFRAASFPSSGPALWTPATLMFGNVDPSEISSTRDSNGYLTQIQSRDVVVNIDSYVAGGTSYHIKVYQNQTPLPANPFITYTVSKYAVSSGTGIRIDKLEDGVNWSTVLQQVGSTWTLYDWRVATAGSPINTSNPVTTIVSGSASTVTCGSADGGQITKTKTFVSVGSNTELASVVMGGTLTTTYSYYSSSTGSGWADSVQSIIQPTGNWTKYDYYNSATDTRAGQIWHIYRPWLNAPLDPSGAGTSSGCVETYDYAANYDGTLTAPMSRVTSVNGTTVGKTTWSYNWTYASANSHTIAQIVEQDYSSSSAYLTTTTLQIPGNDAVTFFQNKPYSVTHPDGTKTSYAYFFGTWDPSSNSFTAGTSGNDRLILAFHGQSFPGSASTQTTSWQWGSQMTWALDPIYLVSDLSTVAETVVDTSGHVVFSAENIYTGTGIECISGTANSYNANNLLTTQKDVMRSVPGGDVAAYYHYSAGLLQTKTDIDGTQTTYGCDNYLRTTSIALSGSGSFPATTQNFAYFSSGLKNTGQESPRNPTVTTYAYESAGTGRPTSASTPKPGGGTLTTSYSYPTLNPLQTTVTLPTLATQTTNLFLDGRVCETNGTGQVDTQYSYSVDASYRYKNTQLGSDQSHGWSEEKFDWLGRPVTLRTPQVGWTSGSSKVVRKTYNYGSLTGQLASVSTTDEANNLARLLPDHLYVYGDLGMLNWEGDDIGNNGLLDASSTDRIIFYNTFFFKDTGGFNGWMRDDQKQVYRTLNNSTDVTTVVETRTRYTRFNNGVLLGNYRAISDVSTIDSSGRVTLDGAWVDPIDHLRMQNHTVQGDSQSAIAYWQDGYPQSSSTISGETKSDSYTSNGLLQSVTEGTTNAEVTYAYYSNTAYQSSATKTHGTSGTVQTSYSYSWDTTRNTAIVAVTDANGGIAYSESNALGLPWHTWGTAAQPSAIGYDAYGRRTSVTTWQATNSCWTAATWPSSPPAGNTVNWTLDPATGAVLSKTYPINSSIPNASTVGFTYNARGQVKTRTWARGVVTNYNYFDTAGSQTGELQQVTYSDGTPEVDYTYMRWGALATVKDASTGTSGLRKFNYGNDLKLANEAFDASFYNSKILTATYDSTVPGRLTGYSFNGSVTVGLTLGFDPTTEQIKTVEGTSGSTNTTFNLGYATGTDWVDSVTNSSGSYNRYLPLVSKDDVISGAATTCNSNTVGDFTAAYADSRGWRSGQTVNVSCYAGALSISSNVTNFTFDSYGQLTGSTGNVDNQSFAWTYDLAGNRKTDTTNSAVTNYTPGTLNQYTAITGSLVESPLTYDADGNLTQDGTWTYAYDGENRLKSMTRTNPSQTLTFVYDYMGRRIRKTVTGISASDTKFLWNGWQLVADLGADGSTVTRSYVWGPDFSDAHGSAGGAGSLLAQISGSGAVVYAVPDALGNTVGYTDSNGNLTAAVEYSAFGRVIKSSGSPANYPIGFAGHYTDWETGLVYYGCRFYSPKHGRFINRDPIEEAGGLNLYGFCGNNGVNGFDSLGMIDAGDLDAFQGNAKPRYSAAELEAQSAMMNSMYREGAGVSFTGCCGMGGLPMDGSDLYYFSGDDNDPTFTLRQFEWLDFFEKRAERSNPPPPPPKNVTLANGDSYTVYSNGVIVAHSNNDGDVEFIPNGDGTYTAQAIVVNQSGGFVADISGTAAPNNTSTPICFVAGTPVATADGGFRPIEEIKVGQRVQTADDASTQNSDTEVKPKDWRKVDFIIPNADGNGGDFELTTLMPVARIEAEGLKVGSDKQVDFEEMGIHGRAQVRSISPCPPIELGRGRVVLSTFTRIGNNLFELRIAGLKDSIQVTGTHPLYSYDRKAWVPAGQLKVGEKLWTASGPSTVESLRPILGRKRVYNFEVEKDHRYYVSTARVLAHNSCVLPTSGTLTISSSGTTGLGIHSWLIFTSADGTTTTYGTWGNNPTGNGNGLFTDLELGRSGDASRTVQLDANGVAAFYTLIGQYQAQGSGAWSYSSPCSSFAANVWNSVTGESLSPYYGPISNPTSLTNSIIKANGGNPNGTGTYGTGSSWNPGNSAGQSSGSSFTTPVGNSLHSSGSF